MTFLSVKEAASKLGYHRGYVLQLLRAGKIPGYKRGKWFIDATELESFIRAGKVAK